MLEPLTVDAERVRCIRLGDEREIAFAVPLETQHAVRLESDVPVVAQYDRLDARQANLAFYTTMGFSP